MSKRMCQPVYNEFITEATLKGRLNTPGFFDDPAIKYAWTKSVWQGIPQRHMNPLQETKASVLQVNNKLSTREDEYLPGQDAKWSDAMTRYSIENATLERLGIVDNQSETETLGEDGQENNPEESGANETL